MGIRVCLKCGGQLFKREGEHYNNFVNRLFCSRTCARVHAREAAEAYLRGEPGDPTPNQIAKRAAEIRSANNALLQPEFGREGRLREFYTSHHGRCGSTILAR